MNERVLVITGISRGLGYALTEEFCRRGHTVAGCARSVDRLRNLQREMGDRLAMAEVDVTSDAAVAAWAADVLRRLGAPDLLLNNAAVINRNAPLWEVSPEDFSRVIDVNLKGVANVIRHFVPAMIQAGRGVIVNFSSGWGRSTDAEVGPYCATKWAIEGLSRSLAQELPGGMASVPLNPGMINTEMLQSCFGAEASHYPTAAEWAARAVPFLLELGARDNGKPLTVPG